MQLIGNIPCVVFFQEVRYKTHSTVTPFFKKGAVLLILFYIHFIHFLFHIIFKISDFSMMIVNKN